MRRPVPFYLCQIGVAAVIYAVACGLTVGLVTGVIP
jgi:hypothetical protein